MMCNFVNSLTRLYAAKKITFGKVKILYENGTITKDEYDFILTHKCSESGDE